MPALDLPPITLERNGEPTEIETMNAPVEFERPPTPSGVTGSWFPALIVLPGQRHALPGKVRVYATPEGLYVYDRVPEDQAQVVAPTPLWYAPIAYAKTSMPPGNYSAQAANGFSIATSKGTVTITVPRGCPVCGVRAMAVWQPVWAHAQVAAEWKAVASG